MRLHPYLAQNYVYRASHCSALLIGCLNFLGRLYNFYIFFKDIGYGNYLLTAPVERKQRKLWKVENFLEKEESTEKIDVSELLSSSNTLTNPNSKKKNHIEL